MKKMFWVILAFAVWALTMNVIRIASHHGVSWVGLGTIATIGVVTCLALVARIPEVSDLRRD